MVCASSLAGEGATSVWVCTAKDQQSARAITPGSPSPRSAPSSAGPGPEPAPTNSIERPQPIASIKEAHTRTVDDWRAGPEFAPAVV
eukprot:8838895-Pyramimonas_sp.AAC.2